MSLIKWRPSQGLDRWDAFGSEIGNLRHEMDRLFSLMMPGFEIGSEDSMFPSAELQDKGDKFALKLEVPGMKPEDMDIQVADDLVTIKGERQSETSTEDEGVTRSEFHYGKFSRRIALPASVKSDEVVAEYKDGILNLVLPKQAKDAQKTVKVEIKS